VSERLAQSRRRAAAAQASPSGDAGPPASPSTTSLADATLVSRVQRLVGERPSCGYRRVTIMLKRESSPRVNHKRVYRVMRQEKLLLQRSVGRPHRVHDGVIVSLKSNLRWCSDTFEIWCWNGERVVAAAGIEQSDRVPEARR